VASESFCCRARTSLGLPYSATDYHERRLLETTEGVLRKGDSRVGRERAPLEAAPFLRLDL